MPQAPVEIRPLRSRADRSRFVTFPWRIYPGDPHWVPPLIRDEKKFIDPRHNPFFDHADVEHFLAWRDGEPVGRIAAIHNRNHNEFHSDRVGFFGLFETIDEPSVARVLLDAAGTWLQARGLDTLRGPVNYSTNETCGLLVEGFDSPPYIMMPYNPPYYARLVEEAGLKKAKDLLAYHISDSEHATVMSRSDALARAFRHRPGVVVRTLDKKKWAREVEIVREIYNQAWERNWGFVPYTKREFDHMAASMKQIVDPRLVGILEVDGRPAGFGLGLPDMNQALRRANGRLFPFGLIKILLAARKIDRARIPILGLLKEHRGKGYDAMLYLHLYRNGRNAGYREAELSWILEDNAPMRRGLDKLGARVYRTYRMYDRSVSS